MKLRFVKYLNDIYLVVGIGYDNSNKECPDHYVVIPLQKNICRAAIYHHTLNIPFSQAIEITDKNTLINLLVLYG